MCQITHKQQIMHTVLKATCISILQTNVKLLRCFPPPFLPVHFPIGIFLKAPSIYSLQQRCTITTLTVLALWAVHHQPSSLSIRAQRSEERRRLHPCDDKHKQQQQQQQQHRSNIRQEGKVFEVSFSTVRQDLHNAGRSVSFPASL